MDWRLGVQFLLSGLQSSHLQSLRNKNNDLQLCNALVPAAHFEDKDTEAQKGQEICLVSHSQDPNLSDSKPTVGFRALQLCFLLGKEVGRV